MIYILAIVVTFFAVGARVFQTKNVAGMHYKLAFGTSWVIELLQGVSILILVDGGLVMIIPLAIGASTGSIYAMYLHNKHVKGKN